MSVVTHKIKLKDTHYLSLWDKNDLPKIHKIQAKIRATSDKDLTDSFFDIMNRKWNDHKPDPEPLELAIDDRFVMTYKGIGKFCRLITKQDATTFKYVAIGNNAPADTNPMPFDQTLNGEEDHVSFEENGFFDATGTSIRYGGTFGESLPTDTYNESLVRNTAEFADNGMIAMCIASFYDNPISHTQGNTGFTAAGSIEFNIIMDISQ